MPSGGAGDRAPQQSIRVWDTFVRIYHWLQATLIAVSWLTSDSLKTVHKASGYAIAMLLLARIIWGFVGPKHARFSDFLRGPRAVLDYLMQMIEGREARFIGHNPAGGAMVIALLGAVAAAALTGWLQTTDAFWGSDLMEGLHETMATLILVLVGLHVGGVLLACVRHGENLVSAMLDGRKAPLGADEISKAKTKR